jgi:HEPN domain-containing protein
MDPKQIDYWISISEYDLEVAQAVFEKGYYLHCGFMCHQSIEKLLKALYVKTTNSLPPRTHNLDRIIKDCGQESIFFKEDFILFDELTPLNIQARYPAYKDLLHKLIDCNKASKLLQQCREMHAWLKQKMN